VTVSVLAHGRTLAAVEHNGLLVISAGETLHAAVQVTGDPADLGAQDYVIVAVKAPALKQVAARIEPLIGPETAVLTAMNGLPWWFFADQKERLAKPPSVDPDGTIARAIPASRVIGCAIYMACSAERPGVIRHHAGRRLLIGAVQERSSDQAKRLGNHLRNAGFDCDVSSDIRRDVWLKLWANLSTNPISLLTTSTLDRIIDDPLVHRLCVCMMEEAAQIGRTIGIDPAASIEEIIDRARLLGAFKTSMLQDAERGRPIEIDALLTVVHEIGRAVGVRTPFIDSVLGLARLRAASLDLLEHAA
jgi:2-dehydropantoate 2-reductase